MSSWTSLGSVSKLVQVEPVELSGLTLCPDWMSGLTMPAFRLNAFRHLSEQYSLGLLPCCSIILPQWTQLAIANPFNISVTAIIIVKSKVGKEKILSILAYFLKISIDNDVKIGYSAGV